MRTYIYKLEEKIDAYEKEIDGETLEKILLKYNIRIDDN